MSKYNQILVYGADYTKQRNVLKSTDADETSAYTNVQMVNGVGKISSVGVKLTKGVKGTITIDMEYSTFSSSSYEKCSDELKNSITSEKYEKLKECEKKSDYKAWWFWLLSASEDEYQHNRDQIVVTKNIDDTSTSKAIEKMFSEEQQKYHIEGTYEVEGQSNVPTVVEMYISTLNVQTSTHSGVSVIDTDSQPMLLNPDTGQKADAKIENKETFKIVPIS